MGRSKKNWDHLVDYYGNYFPFEELFGEDANGNPVLPDLKGNPGEKGDKGRRGFRGPKGNKGEIGNDGTDGIDGDKGEKGEPEGLFHFKGNVPERGDLPAPVPGTEGDVYRVDLTGYLYISDPANGKYIEVQNLDAVPGDKGETGDKGIQGEKGNEGPMLNFDDLTDDQKDQIKGDDGDSAYQVAVIHGFKGSETAWLDSIDGQKGEPGDKGDKLEFRDLSDAEKLALKGQKGEEGLKGSGFNIIGEIGTPGENPNGNPSYVCDADGEGNALVDPSDGQLWICDGNGGWIDSGKLVGPKGEKGEPLEYDDLTNNQKDQLKGQKGEDVKGDKGLKGDTGSGEKGNKGDKGVLPLITDLPSLP